MGMSAQLLCSRPAVSRCRRAFETPEQQVDQHREPSQLAVRPPPPPEGGGGRPAATMQAGEGKLTRQLQPLRPACKLLIYCTFLPPRWVFQSDARGGRQQIGWGGISSAAAAVQ